MINFIILLAYFISLFFMIFWILVLIEEGVKEEDKKLKKYPFVSICVPAYNEEDNIIPTLKSLINLDYPKDKLEIIVVNDGSTDNTEKKVREFMLKHKDNSIILINQKNKGKASALNNALKKAKGEFFVCLDSDSVVNKKALKVLLPYFKKNVAAVLPLIRVAEKDSIMRKIQHCEYLINFFYKKLMSKLNVIHVTPGPFSVYRKRVIKGLGGFDEHNLTEDLEMALKIQKAGYKIIQILGTDVLTKAPKTFRQFYRQRNRWYKGSLLNLVKYREMIFRKKYGDLGIFQLPMVFVSAFITLVLFGIFIYFLIKPLIHKISVLSSVNFDFTPLLKYGVNNFSWLNLNFTPMFYGFTIFILGFIFIYLSYKHTKESLRKNKISIFFYLVLYPFIIAIIWFGVLFDLVLKRIQKW